MTNSLSLKRRLALLLACLAVGLGTGVVGYHFTGDQAWFLALPAALAIVWLFVANPDECGCSRR